MLTTVEVRNATRRRRSPPSLKQQYQEYVMQRIESFKNSLGRDELLRLGDEAVAELQASAQEQLPLTEILLLESVDRQIIKRLSLRSYRRWREQFQTLRLAQRQPTHWGLEPSSPLVGLLPRLEPEDVALIVGAGSEACTYLLAAHDVAVTFIASELGAVERVETRISGEGLGSLFLGYVTPLDSAWPDFGGPAHLVVLDVSALAELDPPARGGVIRELQDRTRPEGVHVLVSGSGALKPEAFRGEYEGWQQETPARSRRRSVRSASSGLVLEKPLPPAPEVQARQA